MHVRYMQVTDFRSWPSLDLPLEPGPVMLIGPNGRGKTNLLEALGYVATLGSHRVSSDTPLVRRGTERALVRVLVVNQDRELTVEFEIAPGRSNRARINRGALGRPRDALGILRTVLFSPEDLALVRGDPDGRRRFLDDLLVLSAPRYAGIRADYDKVLRQRNALLKSTGKRSSTIDQYALSTLDVWDRQLAELGAQLLAGRLNLVAELAPHTVAGYATLAPESDAAAISYRCGIGDALPDGYGRSDGERAEPTDVYQPLLDGLAASRDADLERGVSLVGPHRDELELSLGDGPVKGYASQGESWSFALALRLASYELLRNQSGGEPVLLLDDVFAELDSKRRAALVEIAERAEQVFVTAAVPEDVPEELNGVRYLVSEGGITRA